MSTTPSSNTSLTTAWYHSIAKLPLNKFIEVVVDGNESALIISGFPSQLELQIAWNEIQIEYSDLLADNEAKLYRTLEKEITILQITLNQINILVECLRAVYYEPFLVKLNGLLYTSFKLNPDEPEEYHKTLDRFLNRSKSIKIEIDLKTIQIQALSDKHKDKNAKYTREYFQSILITLSNHAGFHLHENSITVYEFCKRLIDFNKYCELNSKKR